MNKDPKKWTGNYPMGITLAAFTPIVLQSPGQFRPQAPPDFEADMKELKNFKTSGNKLVVLIRKKNKSYGSASALLAMFSSKERKNISVN